jgi:hypothetical protein
MRMHLFAICSILWAAVAIADDRPPYTDVRPVADGDIRVRLFEDAVRTKNLAPSLTFVTTRSKQFEDNALTGAILRGNAIEQTFAATDLLPAGSFAAGTAGQVFGAALLDDQETLAVAIGWTNPKQRNINGIAILKRSRDQWIPTHVIVAGGGVRDLAAGPANSIVAITTDAMRSRNNADVALVTVFDDAGDILAQPVRVRGGQSWETTGAQALGSTVERISPTSVGLMTADGISRVLGFSSQRCESRNPPSNAHFIYPQLRDGCIDVRTIQIDSFADVPPGASSLTGLILRAVHMNADRSVVAVREAVDGSTPRIFVTRYGATQEGVRGWSASGVLWRAIRVTDDRVEAVEVSPQGRALIEARTP